MTKRRFRTAAVQTLARLGDYDHNIALATSFVEDAVRPLPPGNCGRGNGVDDQGWNLRAAGALGHVAARVRFTGWTTRQRIEGWIL